MFCYDAIKCQEPGTLSQPIVIVIAHDRRSRLQFNEDHLLNGAAAAKHEEFRRYQTSLRVISC